MTRTQSSYHQNIYSEVTVRAHDEYEEASAVPQAALAVVLRRGHANNSRGGPGDPEIIPSIDTVLVGLPGMPVRRCLWDDRTQVWLAMDHDDDATSARAMLEIGTQLRCRHFGRLDADELGADLLNEFRRWLSGHEPAGWDSNHDHLMDLMFDDWRTAVLVGTVIDVAHSESMIDDIPPEVLEWLEAFDGRADVADAWYDPDHEACHALWRLADDPYDPNDPDWCAALAREGRGAEFGLPSL